MRMHVRKSKKCIWILWIIRAYYSVNKETIWQVLRMYDVDDKLLNRIKSIYISSLICVRVKGGKNECFRTDGDVRQGCIMSHIFFNVCMDAVMKEVKMGMGRKGVT